MTCLDVDLARCPVENTRKINVNLRANYTLNSKTYLLPNQVPKVFIRLALNNFVIIIYFYPKQIFSYIIVYSELLFASFFVIKYYRKMINACTNSW